MESSDFAACLDEAGTGLGRVDETVQELKDQMRDLRRKWEALESPLTPDWRSERSIDGLSREVECLQSRLESRNESIQELQDTLDYKNERIEELTAKLNEEQERARDLAHNLRMAEADAAGKAELIAAKDKIIDLLQSSLDRRRSSPMPPITYRYSPLIPYSLKRQRTSSAVASGNAGTS